MAAYEARPDLIRLLLTSGASVDAPDRKGRTPVQCVLAPTFFDADSLLGKPSKTTARQRLTLQVINCKPAVACVAECMIGAGFQAKAGRVVGVGKLGGDRGVSTIFLWSCASS